MLRSMGVRLIFVVILGAFPLAAVGQNAALPKGNGDTAKSETPAADARLNKAPAISSEYRVGEGDAIQVSVWKEPDLSKTATVRPDGMVSLPLIGEVKVIALTSSEIKDLVTSKLAAFVVSPIVTVEITEIRSRRIFITGEIVRPGTYPLAGPTTVLQLIAQAGGLTPFAKRKSIVILRQENGRPVKYPFNYSEVVHGRTPEQNIALVPGDTVVVP